MYDWKQLSQIGMKQSRLSSSTWPYDKHPEQQELLAGSRVTILHAEGPGVVSSIHASNYNDRKVITDVEMTLPRDNRAMREIIFRVWYDDEETPSIELPFVDFLGDVDYGAEYYNTVYFSKVMYSHNFRIPMPFRKSIRIELENPTTTDLIGYTDIQWEQQLSALPEHTGYLYTDYRSGNLTIPDETLEVCSIDRPGVIVAHWFQIEGDHPNCHQGEILCEANMEFYMNEDSKPSMEYLGIEDLYGYSWGFPNLQSDHYAAIIRKDDLPNGGARIGMLRCRGNDAIHFTTSCVVKLDYTQEYFSALSVNPNHEAHPEFKKRGKTKLDATYLSCYYYYASPHRPTARIR
jgi:Protein of unknown function (DUF2961).